MMCEPEDVREQLAALSHAQWTGWMEDIKGLGHVDTKGRWVLPKQATERWQRQMQTPYAALPEQEKESDRAEADRVLEVLVAVLAYEYSSVLDWRLVPARTECRELLRRLAELLGVDDLHERARRLPDEEAQP